MQRATAVHKDSEAEAGLQRHGRRLRYVPERSFVEITTRTQQGRFQLRPSPRANDIILGVLGRAERLCGVILRLRVPGRPPPSVGHGQWAAAGRIKT